MILLWLARWPRRRFIRDSAPLLILLALATVVRLPLMPFPGYWHDLASYVNWGNELVSNGFSNLYAVKGSNMALPGANPPGGVVFTAINYPPGMPYLFGGLVLLYNATLARLTHVPLTDLVNHAGIGPFYAKLLILVADLASTSLLYHEARKRHSRRFAWLAAASFAVSPAVLYDGVIWGQTDTLAMLPVLIAVFAILSKRYAIGGLSLAIAVLIKLQSAIFIPLVLLYLWRWARRRDSFRFTFTLVGTALLLMLPVLVPRFQLPDMLYNMHAMSYNNDFALSRDAFNLWWALGLQARALGSTLLGVNAALLAEALFGIVTLILAVIIWRQREPAYLCFGLAMEAFGFFLLMGGQLERYLFPFIPLLLITLIVSERKSSDRLLILYVSATVLCTLNMMATIGAFLAGIAPMIPSVTYPPLSAFMTHSFALFAFIIAVYMVATFGYALWVFFTGQFAPLAIEPPAHGEPSTPLAVSSGITSGSS